MPETKRQEPTSAGGGAPAMAFPPAGADMAARIGQAAMQGLSEHQRQTGRFVARRLQEVARLQQRMAASNSPAALFDAFSDFTLTAMRDYGEQAGKTQEIIAASLSVGADCAAKADTNRKDA